MTSERKLLFGRWISLLLAVGIPMLFAEAAQSQNRKLHALQTHGVRTTGEVTEITGPVGNGFVHYRYAVGNQTYTWNESEKKLPVSVGSRIPLVYLPDDPGKNRVGPPLTDEVIQEETALLRHAIPVTAAIFGASFLLNEIQLRRHRRGGNADAPLRSLFAPKMAGNIVAFVVLAIVAAVNFDPEVRSVQEKAFGERPFGIPIAPFATILSVVLFIPSVWVVRHLTSIIFQARADGASVGQIGLAVYILKLGRTHPEMRRSQAIVAVGMIYFLLLATAWIAYTAHLGI